MDYPKIYFLINRVISLPFDKFQYSIGSLEKRHYPSRDKGWCVIPMYWHKLWKILMHIQRTASRINETAIRAPKPTRNDEIPLYAVTMQRHRSFSWNTVTRFSLVSRSCTKDIKLSLTVRHCICRWHLRRIQIVIH